ncbi:MAG TPA: transglutaminase-like domain-containing protein, partial [Caulobacteraceae bacterium]|nr:transglutaminase-like domain-containing protein [Caulobacteraceae bacterium]
LRIEPLVAESAQVRVAPACLDVRLPVPAGGLAEIGVALEFLARPVLADPAAVLTPDEAELHTRPAEGLIRVTEAVRAAAARVAGDADDSEAVTRLWAFVMETMTCGAVHYDALDVARPLDGVLLRRWCDCQVGSALLAALCRARGVPARLVTGYLLHEMAPAFHTWLEAWIDGAGWKPLDLWGWDLSAGGRDLAWRDRFFGQLDHRMAVERPPRLFAGTGSVRLPAAWRMLLAPGEPGTSVTFEDVDTGALVYREHIVVERLG